MQREAHVEWAATRHAVAGVAIELSGRPLMPPLGCRVRIEPACLAGVPRLAWTAHVHGLLGGCRVHHAGNANTRFA